MIRLDRASHRLGVAAAPAGRQMLEVGLGLRHHGRVEQLAQRLGAEQLRQQRRVERERLRPAFGQRRVALVHERADVAEEQAPPERAGGGRLHLHQLDPAGGEVAQHLGQGRHVEHVLQALPDGFQRDREPGELGRDLKQLRRPLPLLPQRSAPPRLPPGE